MAMNGYVDCELDMMCEGLFDNIEDLLDFSTDDEALGGTMDSVPVVAGGGGGCAYKQIAPPPVPATPVAALNGEGARVAVASDVNKICDDINISEDWITNFLDDTNFELEFPASTAIIAAAPKEEDSLFQSFSPVSVLEEPNNLIGSETTGGSSSYSSSSSSSISTNSSSNETVCLAPVGPTMMLVPGRARSKRPRRAAPAPAHVTVPIVPPASDGPPALPTLLPECESYGESCCPVPTMRKKKKKSHSAGGGGGSASSEEGVGVRRCQHCGLQKTPQWRAGPMGPKTLCNACGVRYKSGRLFPEYRPAASPTFVPSIHSNSHKKVVEMRNKACQQKVADGVRLPEYPAAKNCDLLAYIRGRE